MPHFVNGDTIVVNTLETQKPNTPVAMLWSGSGHLHENKELVIGEWH